MLDQTDFEPPFEYPINVRKLSKKGDNCSFQGDETTCEKISAAYDLIEVTQFHANANVAPWKRDGIKISGAVAAKVVQPCAVTGEPLKADVKEDVEIIFVPEGSKLAKPRMNDDGEWVFDVEGEEVPETFIGDSIDLAAVWLEFFAMGIDPFAKIEGATFQNDETAEAEQASRSPFAVLSKLKEE